MTDPGLESHGSEPEPDSKHLVVAGSIVVMIAAVVLILRPGDFLAGSMDLSGVGTESSRVLFGLMTCYLALVGILRLPRALTTNRDKGSAKAVWSAVVTPIVSLVRFSFRSVWGLAIGYALYVVGLRSFLPLLARDEYGEPLSISPEESAWREVLSPSVTELGGLLEGFADWSTRLLASSLEFFTSLAGIERFDSSYAEILRLEGILFVLLAPTLFATGWGVSRRSRIVTIVATIALLSTAVLIAALTPWIWADAVVFRLGFELVTLALFPIVVLIGLALALLIIGLILGVIAIALAMFFGSGDSPSATTTIVRGANSHFNSDGTAKRPYASERDAEIAADQHFKDFSERKSAYRCEQGTHWHIGG